MQFISCLIRDTHVLNWTICDSFLRCLLQHGSVGHIFVLSRVKYCHRGTVWFISRGEPFKCAFCPECGSNDKHISKELSVCVANASIKLLKCGGQRLTSTFQSSLLAIQKLLKILFCLPYNEHLIKVVARFVLLLFSFENKTALSAYNVHLHSKEAFRVAAQLLTLEFSVFGPSRPSKGSCVYIS